MKKLSFLKKNHKSIDKYQQNIQNRQFIQKKAQIRPVTTYLQNKLQTEQKIASVSYSALNDCLIIYEWRSNTDYPVINARWIMVHLFPNQVLTKIKKPYQYSIFDRSHIEIKVQMEKITKLNRYSPLTLNELFGSLKQSIVGFERLKSLFGSFQITKNMIGINSFGNTKVWLSQNYHQNVKSFKSRDENTSQIANIRNIIQIYQQCMENNQFSINLFKSMQKYKTFLSILQFIDIYTKQNNIKLVRSISKKQKNLVQSPSQPKFNFFNHKCAKDNEAFIKQYSTKILNTKLNIHHNCIAKSNSLSDMITQPTSEHLLGDSKDKNNQQVKSLQKLSKLKLTETIKVKQLNYNQYKKLNQQIQHNDDIQKNLNQLFRSFHQPNLEKKGMQDLNHNRFTYKNENNWQPRPNLDKYGRYIGNSIDAYSSIFKQ